MRVQSPFVWFVALKLQNTRKRHQVSRREVTEAVWRKPSPLATHHANCFVQISSPGHIWNDLLYQDFHCSLDIVIKSYKNVRPSKVLHTPFVQEKKSWNIITTITSEYNCEKEERVWRGCKVEHPVLSLGASVTVQLPELRRRTLSRWQEVVVTQDVAVFWQIVRILTKVHVAIAVSGGWDGADSRLWNQTQPQHFGKFENTFNYIRVHLIRRQVQDLFSLASKNGILSCIAIGQHIHISSYYNVI